MKKKFWTSKWCRGFIWIYTAIGYFFSAQGLCLDDDCGNG